MDGILNTPGESYLDKEVKKEIERNQFRYDKSCKELRSVIEEIGFHNDENKKLEKVKCS